MWLMNVLNNSSDHSICFYLSIRLVSFERISLCRHTTGTYLNEPTVIFKPAVKSSGTSRWGANVHAINTNVTGFLRMYAPLDRRMRRTRTTTTTLSFRVLSRFARYVLPSIDPRRGRRRRRGTRWSVVTRLSEWERSWCVVDARVYLARSLYHHRALWIRRGYRLFPAAACGERSVRRHFHGTKEINYRCAVHCRRHAACAAYRFASRRPIRVVGSAFVPHGFSLRISLIIISL